MSDYNEDEIKALAQHSCPDCGLDMREGKTFFECPSSGCGYLLIGLTEDGNIGVWPPGTPDDDEDAKAIGGGDTVLEALRSAYERRDKSPEGDRE